jgi:purine-binding chemotaxis protein CheW
MGLVQNEVKEKTASSIKSRIQDTNAEFKQWITFFIDGEVFAFEALKVIEVQRYSQITPVPGSLSFISGLINLRGKVITVIDTRVLFSLPLKAPDDDTNIILVDFNQYEMVGFIVDSVSEVLSIATQDIDVFSRVSGSTTKNLFVQGVAYYKNNMVITLDLGKINLHLSPMDEVSP